LIFGRRRKRRSGRGEGVICCVIMRGLPRWGGTVNTLWFSKPERKRGGEHQLKVKEKNIG